MLEPPPLEPPPLGMLEPPELPPPDEPPDEPDDPPLDPDGLEGEGMPEDEEDWSTQPPTSMAEVALTSAV